MRFSVCKKLINPRKLFLSDLFIGINGRVQDTNTIGNPIDELFWAECSSGMPL